MFRVGNPVNGSSIQASVSVEPDFRILWVDDHPGSNVDGKSTLDQWYSKNHSGSELIVTEVQSVNEALGKLRVGEYFDLVMTDYRLRRSEPDGTVLVERLRARSPFMDVIFYTRRGALPKGVGEKVVGTGFAAVVQDDQLVPTTMKLISQRLERFEQASFLRGAVISAFVELDRNLNHLLVTYFRLSDELGEHFKSSILENANVSYWAKFNALKMIIFGKLEIDEKAISPPFKGVGFKKLKSGIDALRSAENDRNILAHCIPLPGDKLKVVSMGVAHTYDRRQIIKSLQHLAECEEFVRELSDALGPRK